MRSESRALQAGCRDGTQMSEGAAIGTGNISDFIPDATQKVHVRGPVRAVRIGGFGLCREGSFFSGALALPLSLEASTPQGALNSV